MAEATCARSDCAETFRRKGNKRYCTDRCQRIAERRRYRSRHRETAECPHCRRQFSRVVTRGKPQVYCSLDCQYEARSKDYKRRGIQPQRVTGLGLSIYYAALRNDPCAYCGGSGGEIDHIVSRKRGGPNHWENYTGACRACNQSKERKSVLGFLGWQPLAKAQESWRAFDYD